MAIYDGYVSVGDEEIHVILGVEDERLTLSSNGSEIGEWPTGEVAIDHMGDGAYAITAEDESLRFVPNDPDLFAIGFGPSVPVDASTQPDDVADGPNEAATSAGERVEDAPAPNPTTRVVFYALVVMTASLGLWALASMLLG